MIHTYHLHIHTLPIEADVLCLFSCLVFLLFLLYTTTTDDDGFRSLLITTHRHTLKQRAHHTLLLYALRRKLHKKETSRIHITDRCLNFMPS